MSTRPDEPTDENPEWTEEMFAASRPGREVVHFEIYQTGGDWRWRLVAANAEVIAWGEAYRSKADCLRAVELLQRTSAETPIEDRAAA